MIEDIWFWWNGIIKNSKKDEKLREHAENLLKQKIKDLDIPHNIKEIIHELQVHQIELEMQNEELKHSHLKLQSSQNRYFDLYNFAPTGYFTLDKNELIKDVNLAGASLLGMEKNNLINSAFIRFIAPDSRNKFSKLFKNAISTKKIKKCDLDLLKNQNHVPVHMETYASYDKDGNFKEFFINVSDITELKEYENALRESEVKYKSLFKLNPDYTVFLDPEGKILDANISALENLGYNLDKIRGSVLSEFGIFPPEDVKIYKEKIQKLLKGENIEPFLARLVDKNSKIHFCQTHLIPIKKEGNLMGYQAIAQDITEKILAEKELRSSQIKLINAMELSNLVNWEYDVASDTFTFDDRFYALYGTSTTEEGSNKMSSEVYASKFIPPEDSDIVAREIAKAMETDDPNYFGTIDHRIIRADGEERYITVRFGIIKDAEGHTIKTYGANQDITERKKMEIDLEKLLIESKSLQNELSTLIENIVDEVWFCDLKGNIILANAAARKFEHEAEFEASKSLNGLIKSVEVYDAEGTLRPREGSPLLRSLNDEILTDYEEIVVFPHSGRRQFRQVSSAPIKNDKGEIIGAVAVARDITEHKKAEELLKEIQEEKSKIVDLLNEAQEIAKIGSWEWDLKTNEVWWSDETYHIFGVNKDYVPSFEANADFIHPDDLEKYREKFKHSLKTGETLDLDVRIVTKTGEVKDSYVPGKVVYDESGKPKRFIGNIMDITERKKDEDEIKKSLEEKKVLLREIHHRVKNNLQIIASLLHLQEFSVDEDETADILKESEGRVKSMAIIHEKLYQSPSLTEINFKQYIEKLVSDILYTYGIPTGNIKTNLIIRDINLNIDTSIPLGLIINELVTNSVKYAFPNGEGSIKIELKPLPEKMLLIISDDGIGIPNEIDFKKTESLGLQLVNSLINQLEGEIELDRKHGTKFTIKFHELKYEPRI